MKQTVRFKTGLITSLIVLWVNVTWAQTAEKHYWTYDSSSTLWQPHSQLMEGYSLWLLRQNLSLTGNQTIVQTETDLQNKRFNKLTFVTYLPILHSKHWTLMAGTRYQMYDVLTNHSGIDRSLQRVWFWDALEYRNKKWKFILTTENYFKGDDTGLWDKTGRQFFTIFYVGYEINPRWNLVFMARYNRQQMENSSYQNGIGGVQLRFRPSAKFKVLFGMPSLLAFEWSLRRTTEVGFAYFIEGEMSSYVQQQLSKRINIALIYNRTTDDNLYFRSSSIKHMNQNILFNNLQFTNSQLSIEMGVCTNQHYGLNFGLAYNFKETVKLYENRTKLNAQFETKPFVSFNLRLQFLKQ